MRWGASQYNAAQYSAVQRRGIVVTWWWQRVGYSATVYFTLVIGKEAEQVSVRRNEDDEDYAWNRGCVQCATQCIVVEEQQSESWRMVEVRTCSTYDTIKAHPLSCASFSSLSLALSSISAAHSGLVRRGLAGVGSSSEEFNPFEDSDWAIWSPMDLGPEFVGGVFWLFFIFSLRVLNLSELSTLFISLSFSFFFSSSIFFKNSIWNTGYLAWSVISKSLTCIVDLWSYVSR